MNKRHFLKNGWELFGGRRRSEDFAVRSGAFISGPGGAGKAAGSAILPLRNTRTSPSADVPDRPGDEQIEDETEVASQYTDGLIGRKEQAGQAPWPRRRSGVGEDGRRRLGWLPAGGAWRLRLQLSRDSRGRRPGPRRQDMRDHLWTVRAGQPA